MHNLVNQEFEFGLLKKEFPQLNELRVRHWLEDDEEPDSDDVIEYKKGDDIIVVRPVRGISGFEVRKLDANALLAFQISPNIWTRNGDHFVLFDRTPISALEEGDEVALMTSLYQGELTIYKGVNGEVSKAFQRLADAVTDALEIKA